MSIICNEKTSNTVIAAEDCTVLHLGRESESLFLENKPEHDGVSLCRQVRTKNQTFDEFRSMCRLKKVLPFDFELTSGKPFSFSLSSLSLSLSLSFFLSLSLSFSLSEHILSATEEALERILFLG